MVGGRGVRLADESAVRDAEWFVCVDLNRICVEMNPLIRTASAIQPEWLDHELILETTELRFDPA